MQARDLLTQKLLDAVQNRQWAQVRRLAHLASVFDRLEQAGADIAVILRELDQ